MKRIYLSLIFLAAAAVPALAAPSAQITFLPAPPATIYVGEPVVFDGTASTSYSTALQNDKTSSVFWNLGDGSTMQLIRGAHAYMAAGNYTVLLTVKDGSGQSNTATAYIRV